MTEQHVATGYADGCLTIATRHGEVIYFAARKIGGKVYSGPKHWTATLMQHSSPEDHANQLLNAVMGALRWAENQLTHQHQMMHPLMESSIVDEEFFLSYAGEMPEGWMA